MNRENLEHINKIYRKTVYLIILSLPYVASRLGLVTLEIVDAIMLGHYGADDLAYKSIGASFTYLVVSSVVGLLSGTLILSAVKFGQKKFKECGQIWQYSMFYGLIISFVMMAFCYFGHDFLKLSGQVGELASRGGAVIRIIGYGIPFLAIFVASSGLLEAIGKSKIPTFAIITGNLFNILFNWALVFGHLGFSAMGAEGSAWATTLTRIIIGLFLIAYLFASKDMKIFELFNINLDILKWKNWKKYRNFGYGTAAAMMMEEVAFYITVQYAGWIGSLAVAGYAIGLNVLTATFMMSVGLGAATAAQVGMAVGKKQYKEAINEGWFGLVITIMFMSVGTFIVRMFPDYVVLIYTSDEKLISYSIPVIMFLGFILILDGWQGLISNALRGLGDVWVPTIIQAISYICLLVPSAYYFGVYLNGGAVGLFKGSVVGSISAAVLLTIRFCYKSKMYKAKAEAESKS
jgi:MATE family multidrug resistance protein